MQARRKQDTVETQEPVELLVSRETEGTAEDPEKFSEIQNAEDSEEALGPAPAEDIVVVVGETFRAAAEMLQVEIGEALTLVVITLSSILI